MDKKEKLYLNLIKNNVPIIEIEDDYYMIFNKKILRCSNGAYQRNKNIIETKADRSKINKLSMSVEMAYQNTNSELWEDLKEFIDRLDEKDIDIANESYNKYMEEK